MIDDNGKWTPETDLPLTSQIPQIPAPLAPAPKAGPERIPAGFADRARPNLETFTPHRPPHIEPAAIGAQLDARDRVHAELQAASDAAIAHLMNHLYAGGFLDIWHRNSAAPNTALVIESLVRHIERLSPKATPRPAQ